VMSEAEIGKDLKVASLYYLSLKGLATSLNMSVDRLHASHCTGCLDYHNPFDMRIYDMGYQRTPYAKAMFVKKSESKSKKLQLPVSIQPPQ